MTLSHADIAEAMAPTGDSAPAKVYMDDTGGFIAQCERDGLQVVYPEPYELQIDIDSERQRETFEDVWPMFETKMNAKIIDRHFSRSGAPKEHITVCLPFEVSELMRVALQAILGSDGKRELYGVGRVMTDTWPVSIFVELAGVPVRADEEPRPSWLPKALNEQSGEA